jgi:hypothetical protein
MQEGEEGLDRASLFVNLASARQEIRNLQKHAAVNEAAVTQLQQELCKTNEELRQQVSKYVQLLQLKNVFGCSKCHVLVNGIPEDQPRSSAADKATIQNLSHRCKQLEDELFKCQVYLEEQKSKLSYTPSPALISHEPLLFLPTIEKSEQPGQQVKAMAEELGVTKQQLADTKCELVEVTERLKVANERVRQINEGQGLLGKLENIKMNVNEEEAFAHRKLQQEKSSLVLANFILTNQLVGLREDKTREKDALQDQLRMSKKQIDELRDERLALQEAVQVSAIQENAVRRRVVDLETQLSMAKNELATLVERVATHAYTMSNSALLERSLAEALECSLRLTRQNTLLGEENRSLTTHVAGLAKELCQTQEELQAAATLARARQEVLEGEFVEKTNLQAEKAALATNYARLLLENETILSQNTLLVAENKRLGAGLTETANARLQLVEECRAKELALTTKERALEAYTAESEERLRVLDNNNKTLERRVAEHAQEKVTHTHTHTHTPHRHAHMSLFMHASCVVFLRHIPTDSCRRPPRQRRKSDDSTHRCTGQRPAHPSHARF